MPIEQSYQDKNRVVNQSGFVASNNDPLNNIFRGRTSGEWINESVDNIGQNIAGIAENVVDSLVVTGQSIADSVKHAVKSVDKFLSGSGDMGKKKEELSEARTVVPKETPTDTITKNTSSSMNLEYPIRDNSGKYKFKLNFYQYVRPNPLVVAKEEFKFSVTLPLPRELLDTVNIDISEGKYGELWGAAANMLTSNEHIRNGDRHSDRSMTESGAGVLALYQGLNNSRLKLADTVVKVGSQEIGAIPNPHPSIFFGGVRMKQHVFTYRFSPTSKDEGVVLTNVINRLKAAALPKFVANDVNILQYPLMVKPQFIPDSLAAKLYPFKYCLIESINVQYSPHGVPTFYHDSQPQTIEMTINMREIEYVLANDYDEAVAKSNQGQVANLQDWYANKGAEIDGYGGTILADNTKLPGET